MRRKSPDVQVAVSVKRARRVAEVVKQLPAGAEIAPAIARAPQTSARLIKVEPGLHVLSLGATDGTASILEGIALPAIQIASPPSNLFDPVEIITAWNEGGAWLGKSGGVVVLRSPPGGGQVLITAYAAPDEMAVLSAEIGVRPLERSGPAALAAARIGPPADPREVDLLISLHIARQGDRSFSVRGWAGNLGRGMQIEAFSIAPQSKLLPDDIEYKAFGPQGRETRWTSEGRLCGTRGRGLPLTGFAVQALPRVRDRFDVIYQGAFIESGVSEPFRNGEPCLSSRADDILEAINLRVIERGRV